MLAKLETLGRRGAIASALQSVIGFAFVIAPWFFDRQASPILPWYYVVGIAFGVPVILLLTWPLGRLADTLAKHLKPLPPTSQFQNVASEIAIALNEPIESIQIHDSSIPNIASLPCTKGEIVVATIGALERLSRHEIQALVAAQFAGMRDRWCRLATRAEIMWWSLRWLFLLMLLGPFFLNIILVFLTYFGFVFYLMLPRWIEQTRDLCADIAAVKVTLDPVSLGRAMRLLGGHSKEAIKIEFGAWYFPNSPFLVIPPRTDGVTTVGGRHWTTSEEVELEFKLRAERAEALAAGANPSQYTGKEFRRRWRQLGNRP
jgi:Zn-dependent protease with chaperone function